VPFRFDVHALVFGEDAVSLENRLHHDLADRRVNRVNLRREFLRATPAEVLAVLERTESREHLLEYTEFPEAEEWRTSLKLSQRGDDLVSVNRPGVSGELWLECAALVGPSSDGSKPLRVRRVGMSPAAVSDDGQNQPETPSSHTLRGYGS
jgi:hypothetical protein